MTEKETVYQHCQNVVQERITRILTEIHQAQNSANEETKSSAGDKYETGRAMAQLEIERHTIQLKEAEKVRDILNSLSLLVTSEQVRPGSLVSTSKGIFYIAISLGNITVQNKKYFVVSSDSPIGKLLLGKHCRESINWNGSELTIHQID